MDLSIVRQRKLTAIAGSLERDFGIRQLPAQCIAERALKIVEKIDWRISEHEILEKLMAEWCGDARNPSTSATHPAQTDIKGDVE